MDGLIYAALPWLLLPAAAGLGWWMAQRTPQRHAGTVTGTTYPQEYFRGLNYILNEQPDKAVELFVGMLERYVGTVELHLVLGKLFRRCGELDRAIHVHQSLLSRSDLSEDQRFLFLHELGIDYLRAGLLDRAESLFQQVVDDSEDQAEASLSGLLELYQQERDWESAVRTSRRLQAYHRRGIGAMIAQFYCEQAALMTACSEDRRSCLEQALTADPQCVRASLAQAEFWFKQEKTERAISALQRVERQDADFLPEIITPLLQCYAAQGRSQEGLEYLRSLYDRHGGTSLLLVSTRNIADTEGAEAAMHYLADELRRYPSVRGVQQLLTYMVDGSHNAAPDELGVVCELVAGFLAREPLYACQQCGFSARSLYWHCPGCRGWGRVKPVRERGTQ